MIDKDELIYIASLIDSQGSIFITPHPQSYYVLTMGIYHRDKSILEFVQKLFEAGNIYADRNSFQLRFGGWDTYKVLKATLPYLRLKSEQAKLAIEFQVRKKYRARPLPDKEIEFRKACYERMKELKH